MTISVSWKLIRIANTLWNLLLRLILSLTILVCRCISYNQNGICLCPRIYLLYMTLTCQYRKALRINLNLYHVRITWLTKIFSEKQPESIVRGLSSFSWSGKMSLLYRMYERFDYLKTNDKSVTIFRNVPWKVTNRDTLMTSFLILLRGKSKRRYITTPRFSWIF